MVNELNLPQLTQDTYMDQGAPNAANNLNGLSIGNSSVTNVNTDASTAVVSFDLSKYKCLVFMKSCLRSLTLSATGGSGIVDVSASALVTPMKLQHGTIVGRQSVDQPRCVERC